MYINVFIQSLIALEKFTKNADLTVKQKIPNDVILNGMEKKAGE